MCDAFVLPSRGEGWGRPHTEAMVMGLPCIATNWSGNTEFMSDANSFPIQVCCCLSRGGCNGAGGWSCPGRARGVQRPSLG
mmetsp:Transcript_7526/g.16673  ORF Transcript_7526/g.16673 Transcript_7526/m.16673 type:complete len:81 (+) Transcript_7526:1012-1254(+)